MPRQARLRLPVPGPPSALRTAGPDFSGHPEARPMGPGADPVGTGPAGRTPRRDAPADSTATARRPTPAPSAALPEERLSRVRDPDLPAAVVSRAEAHRLTPTASPAFPAPADRLDGGPRPTEPGARADRWPDLPGPVPLAATPQIRVELSLARAARLAQEQAAV